MTHAPRKLSESDIYHITARGVGRQQLFEDDDDRRRFIKAMKESKDECSVSLLAWCLMDNHVHLLLKGDMERISLMMRRLLGSYAMQFNLLHGRIGHLFQDRFHSNPVDSDEQLLAALRYVHLNPQDMGYDYRRYPWSSYAEYDSRRPVLCTIEPAISILGDEDAFRELHEASTMKSGDDPAASNTRQRLSAGEVASVVDRVLGDISPYDLKSLGRDERDALIARLREGGLSVRQIERLTGIGRGIISRACM